ncbi:large subunit ribosomal protein L21e [Babesia microti strain RI]|uniref:Large subunit ribosomal protein L21e n=1 Tax=Babesia microti (strain RI) TaxID=1133968 RepID=I7J8J3_BABMR|nr:large subunit ribosomal protein L21e [Babesia microti strain RI]CCF72889.1 large subunit ribosomal protein L21e [Babesia microti strain RI]|eukprot:XP_012647498.1 large subunit ribosomal protein L21e [Babesia microti strain RI]
MPHSFGIRSRTRKKYSKAFRRHGMSTVGRCLQTFKRGEYVDIICDPAQHRGMPHSFYHGRTGIVYNVAPRALSVMVRKVVGNREILKRINVHIDHVRKSRCREDFINRVKANDRAKNEAKARGESAPLCKRQPAGVSPGYIVKADPNSIITMDAIPFVEKY